MAGQSRTRVLRTCSESDHIPSARNLVHIACIACPETSISSCPILALHQRDHLRTVLNLAVVAEAGYDMTVSGRDPCKGRSERREATAGLGRCVDRQFGGLPQGGHDEVSILPSGHRVSFLPPILSHAIPRSPSCSIDTSVRGPHTCFAPPTRQSRSRPGVRPEAPGRSWRALLLHVEVLTEQH